MGLFDIALGIFSFFTGMNVDYLKSSTKGAMERLNEMERNYYKLLRETNDPQRREEIEDKLKQIRQKKEEIYQNQQEIEDYEEQVNNSIAEKKNEREYNKLVEKMNALRDKLDDFDRFFNTSEYQEYKSSVKSLFVEICESIEKINDLEVKEEIETEFYELVTEYDSKFI